MSSNGNRQTLEHTFDDGIHEFNKFKKSNRKGNFKRTVFIWCLTVIITNYQVATPLSRLSNLYIEIIHHPTLKIPIEYYGKEVNN